MLMKKLWKCSVVAAIACSLLVTSACNQKRIGTTPDETESVSPLQTENLHNRVDNNFRILSQQTDQMAIPITRHEGKEYVPIERLVDVLQLNSEIDPTNQSMSIGDNDAVYKLFFDVNQMEKEGETLSLDDSPIVLNNQPLLPVGTINTVFGEEMNYHLAQDSLLVYPQQTQVTREEINQDTDVNDRSLDFAEDPNDPFKQVDIEKLLQEDVPAVDEAAAALSNLNTSHAVPVAKIKNVDIPELIRYGRRYMGVKYDFGAKPYAQSKRFDCSSFTQHVYKKYGVTLKRLSRSQAKQGIAVSRKSLRKGDLMFFYVPGRFKTNKTVGHVGIYIGNNKMLHSSPDPKDGVQITNINKAYWKETFLRARRVVR